MLGIKQPNVMLGILMIQFDHIPDVEFRAAVVGSVADIVVYNKKNIHYGRENLPNAGECGFWGGRFPSGPGLSPAGAFSTDVSARRDTLRHLIESEAVKPRSRAGHPGFTVLAFTVTGSTYRASACHRCPFKGGAVRESRGRGGDIDDSPSQSPAASVQTGSATRGSFEPPEEPGQSPSRHAAAEHAL